MLKKTLPLIYTCKHIYSSSLVQLIFVITLESNCLYTFSRITPNNICICTYYYRQSKDYILHMHIPLSPVTMHYMSLNKTYNNVRVALKLSLRKLLHIL